ncbi:MAG: helix-turn-helix transcriptional regulator [Geobacteraceae bacterium]|nr:helix-turn-helix transcriptional regulator [Geobacteraceae bacterium]NTW80732.1 helix-turn-helix transcriptional regulator [Geobacteraceae bacterium]
MGLDPKIIGYRIKEKRQQLKLSQKELAEKIEVTPSAINQYEKGDKVPSSEKIISLAKTLGVSSDYLLGVSNDDDIFLDESITMAFKAFKELGASDRDNIVANINFLRDKAKKKTR